MQYLIYVKVPRYELEWCEHHFGRPCQFPSSSNLPHVLRHFTRERPIDAPAERREEGELAIVLPDSRAKRPDRFNFLTHHGKRAVAEAIDNIFTMHLWEDLTDIGCRSVQLSCLVMDWMEANGISMEGNNYENLRMKFQRIKDAYRRRGVNISRGYKHEH